MEQKEIDKITAECWALLKKQIADSKLLQDLLGVEIVEDEQQSS